MRHPAPFWTVAEDDALRDLLTTTDLCAKEMGKRIGRTKNAVIGRAFRLHLSMDPGCRGRSTLPEPEPERPPPPRPTGRRGERCGIFLCLNLSVDYSGLCSLHKADWLASRKMETASV